jgi:hypothetical protein
VAKEIRSYMFSLSEKVINGFYKKVLYNMLSFWFSLDRKKILDIYGIKPEI